jgi:hypothetical protein
MTQVSYSTFKVCTSWLSIRVASACAYGRLSPTQKPKPTSTERRKVTIAYFLYRLPPTPSSQLPTPNPYK